MEKLVEKILMGDKKALEKLVKDIQENIFNLALRFLWSKEDAEDATQEIILRVISNLSKFEGKSKFTTWVYRIAVNHLLNLKKNKLEQSLSFSAFGKDIENGLKTPSYEYADQYLLVEEVKIGCTLGMLICLDRNLRIAYIIGEVFELMSSEASEILEITPENFRKRLSQSRKALQNFMSSYCGLTNKSNACRCDKRINYALQSGRINKPKLNFVSADTLNKSKTEMEKLYSTSAIFKSHPLNSMDKNKRNEILNIITKLENIV
jgi:DNA-directed RNA polymerase specialized sigma24 family protein